MLTIGDKIRLLRTQKGLTQENMAESLKMSPTGYVNIEQNKTNISFKKLEEIANALETNVFELLSMGEKNFYYIAQNTQKNNHNGFVINNNLPIEYQELVNKVSLLASENDSLKKEIAYLKEIIDLMRNGKDSDKKA
jgi:transcriptional regulator with XRE-family HTH domain